MPAPKPRWAKPGAPKSDKKCPPHDMKEVHKSVDFKGRGKNKKKITTQYLECKRPGCDHEDTKVTEVSI
jgi:hypothetical protein